MKYDTLAELTQAHPEWQKAESLPDLLSVLAVSVYAQRHPDSVLTAMRNGTLRAVQSCRGGTWRTHVSDVQRWTCGLPAEVPGASRSGRS